ncbi:LysR family transcriptional regulator [Microbulbifer sp. OS29]|uniref:LysR family transcriptional regulator n=1 Tax=Microbulbifer okhotskensis TaxID=2926617 RepID=A0A9X2J5T2_9GAMM|nr:LysR family transcriptional regulator [Microbulbifer okhotskensis]MCO1335877.1 LysR family transcriptional regulator [Microbulbifer okhotskensis]
MRKLPSTNLLVTFDAAARHLSFKKAAQELFVTPSAVGHQIRALETELQTKLFVRLNRTIELTHTGRQYHLKIAKSLQVLRHATADLMERDQYKTLTIHSIPFLTNTILAPNIKSFKALHPKLNISIESKLERVSLNPGQLQIAIRYDKEPSDGLCYREISKISISPVCAPGYLKKNRSSQIQLSTDKIGWHKWQADWGSPLAFNETLTCDGLQPVLEMAEQGLGVAMGYFPALTPKVSAGKLELLYPEKFSELAPLYLAFGEPLQGNGVIEDFIDWFKGVVQLLET